jgi:hypothetical protein
MATVHMSATVDNTIGHEWTISSDPWVTVWVVT